MMQGIFRSRSLLLLAATLVVLLGDQGRVDAFATRQVLSPLSLTSHQHSQRLHASVSSTTASESLAQEDAIPEKSPLFHQQSSNGKIMPRWRASIVRAGMMAFILSMCISLPLTLYPQRLLYKLGLIDKVRKERWALSTAQFCSRWNLRLFPFARLYVKSTPDPDPQPAVWVCNHTSMLDVFLLMAADLKLRGPTKRPIKIVYWKGLEDNPVTKLLFRQAGFISVEMAANGNGNSNDYDKSSFKKLLKDSKQAFTEGFDIGILPEGQLNPTPEKGLLPVFGGAYSLAKMAKRPVYMMALHGAHRLWHPDDEIAMKVTGRDVSVRVYPHGRFYKSADDFKAAFQAVVGTFGTTGEDLPEPELTQWLTGDTKENA